MIFPEGTRSRKGNEILDFKAGTFKSAVKAGCPIIPVALVNSFRPFDISSIKKEKVQVHFLKAIYPEQYMGLKTTEIAELVHDRIQEEINKNIWKKYVKNGLTSITNSCIIATAPENQAFFGAVLWKYNTEKYSRGRRGAPAKGVGRATGARVQIPLSPLYCQRWKHWGFNASFFENPGSENPTKKFVLWYWQILGGVLRYRTLPNLIVILKMKK